MKSAIVEREVGDVDSERALLREGLEKHPHSEKLWLMLGQLERRSGADDAAREAYQKARGGVRDARRCGSSSPRLRRRAGSTTAPGRFWSRAGSGCRAVRLVTVMLCKPVMP